MKKLLKTLSISFMMIILMSTFVFAGEALEEIDSYGEYEASVFSNAAQGYHGQLDAATDEELATLIDGYAEYPDILPGLEALKSLKNGERSFAQYGPYALYQTETGDARVYQMLEYNDGYYVLVVGFDSSLQFNFLRYFKVAGDNDKAPATFDITTIKLKEIGGGGSPFKLVFDKEVLAGAAGNTITGLLVVFSVLIFISLIISLFKFISPEGRSFKAPEVKKSEPKAVSKSAQPVANDNEMVAAITAAVVTDETQLVAAITAAICAYEGVSSDSFVVRSIKKRR